MDTLPRTSTKHKSQKIEVKVQGERKNQSVRQLSLNLSLNLAFVHCLSFRRPLRYTAVDAGFSRRLFFGSIAGLNTGQILA
jgi:hypothetical protein